MTQDVYGVAGTKAGTMMLLIGIVVLSLMGTGCVHPIAFHTTDTSWHYWVDAQKQDDNTSELIGDYI